jgi:hypothetical protein
VHLDLLLDHEEVHADAALQYDLGDAGDGEGQGHRDHADVRGPEGQAPRGVVQAPAREVSGSA